MESQMQMLLLRQDQSWSKLGKDGFSLYEPGEKRGNQILVQDDWKHSWEDALDVKFDGWNRRRRGGTRTRMAWVAIRKDKTADHPGSRRGHRQGLRAKGSEIVFQTLAGWPGFGAFPPWTWRSGWQLLDHRAGVGTKWSPVQKALFIMFGTQQVFNKSIWRKISRLAFGQYNFRKSNRGHFIHPLEEGAPVLVYSEGWLEQTLAEVWSQEDPCMPTLVQRVRSQPYFRERGGWQ